MVTVKIIVPSKILFLQSFDFVVFLKSNCSSASVSPALPFALSRIKIGDNAVGQVY
jgi:hypothetical protein